MIYNSKQLERTEKPRPTVGWHTMQIAREFPNKKNGSQHTIVLQNQDYGIWFNCFLSDLSDFGMACDAELDESGNFDTAQLVGKVVDIFCEEKQDQKTGKKYINITDYRMAVPGSIELASPSTAEEEDEIPF